MPETCINRPSAPVLHRLWPLLLALVLLWPTLAAGGSKNAVVPSVDEPVRTGASNPSDAAVVIGNEDYAYLADVPYAARDAQAFADWLLYTRGIPADNLHLLVNVSHVSMLCYVYIESEAVNPWETMGCEEGDLN